MLIKVLERCLSLYDHNDHSLKEQGEAFGSNHSIYKLIGIGVRKEGDLITLTRRAIINNDFEELDEFILEHLSKYLYNNGTGEKVRRLK
jgi:hypothetical protein